MAWHRNAHTLSDLVPKTSRAASSLAVEVGDVDEHSRQRTDSLRLPPPKHPVREGGARLAPARPDLTEETHDERA